MGLATKLALFVSVLVGVVCACIRITAVHGVESAFVLGLVLPPFVAVAAASETHRRITEWRVSAGEILARAGLIGLVVWLVPVVILAFSSLRVRNCSPGEGLTFMLLGPGFGVLLGALIGALCGLLLGRRGAKVAWLIPIVSILWGLFRFYDSPAIFGYDHFVGFFQGTPYDEAVGMPTPLLSLRVITTAWLVAIAAGIAAFFPDGERRFNAPQPLATLLFVVALGFGFFGFIQGEELGHRASSEFVAETLGGELEGERCTVHFPAESPHKERLLADCEFRIVTAERFFGVHFTGRLHAFFFRSLDEKRRLMGAGRTYIAKPWRREVYLQMREWPHPVLAHEIAHVVAGEFGSGPFRIAARWGGLLPDASLIEGAAVAAAWHGSEGLDPHQWSAALLELERLPGLAQTEGLGFVAQPSRMAYTAMGSLYRFISERHGRAAVAKAYTAGDWRASGIDLATLETEWHAFLREQRVPEGASDYVAAKFRSHTVFSATCPHVAARLDVDLRRARRARDHTRADALCTELLDIRNGDPQALLEQIRIAADRDDVDAARSMIEALPETLPAPYRDAADERVADLLWQRDEHDAAAEIYVRIAASTHRLGDRRRRQVKLEGVRMPPESGDWVREIFLGHDDVGSEPQVVLERARRIEAAREDGLGAYLVARQLANAGRPDLARPELEKALVRGLPSPSLTAEAERMRAMACLELRDTPCVEQALEQTLEITATGLPLHHREFELAREDLLLRLAHP